MNKFFKFTLFALTVFALGSCGGAADNRPVTGNSNTANTNASVAKPAAPTLEALFAMDKAANEAFIKGDASHFKEILSDKFMSYMGKRMDKAEMVKMIGETKCDVKSWSVDEPAMTQVDADTAIVTYKGTFDGTCGEHKLPSPVWAASVWIRNGDKWQGAFHGEKPMVDPKAPPPPPAKKDETKPADTKTDDAKPDALTEALLAVETKSWEAWKARDSKPVEEIFSKDFLYLSDTGRMNKSETIKAWFEPKCDVKSYSLTDAKSVSLGANAALLTFRGNAAGTCDGNPLMNLSGTTVFVKEGEKWTPIFYMDTM